MSTKTLTSNDATSAIARVLEMLNTWFRYERIPPSYRQIAAFAGVPVSRVRTYLDRLEARGHLHHQPGVERSIVMADRCANITDEEMIRSMHGRNITVVLPPPMAAALGVAYPLDPRPADESGTNCIADLMDKLSDIP